MTFKIFGRNIAAVSLIEIMMIFTIIGIVTLACANLSKPKYEYTKKIKLYTALSELESAAKILTKEGHLDFTTDLGICTGRTSAHVCTDYADQFPGQNNQLPKVSMRDAFSVVDVGINTTAYANLATDIEKNQFKYLQGGLCQRLSNVFNVPETSVNCSATTNVAGIIDDNNAYPTNFAEFQPQIYLPNGQVIYIGKNAYTDFKTTSGTTTRHRLIVEPVYSDYNSMSAVESGVSTDSGVYCAAMNAFLPLLATNTSISFITLPNETRARAINFHRHGGYCVPSGASDFYYEYLEDMWSKNKDYFIVYVDIDCRKTSTNDKQCGTDRLNEDVFAFRMYRDGTVLPDYASGFPQDALTAKVLVKDKADMFGRYRNLADYAYANMPLNKAKCYASLSGTYQKYNYYDYTGMCTFNSDSIKALDDCVINGESVCKAILNKPSFIMR